VICVGNGVLMVAGIGLFGGLWYLELQVSFKI
jgi:hypothetical protein